ncbi:methyltransferase domain-containing protein [Schaalia turicensis]|uniref:methyltransferase domain-containing protein n=1 Tax=Schaalia turicensis TaxID=131111 RepID=UPI00058F8BB1|nr:methyltransferase domain-containing protein [Schaalia turicensis]
MLCQHWNAGRCHSCTNIEVPYGDQLATKTTRVRDQLADVAGATDIAWLPPVASSPTGFRTNAKLVVGGTRRRPTLGILGRDRRGVDLPDCPIQHSAINRATPGLKRFIRQLNLTPYDVPTKSGELKYVLLTVGVDNALMCRFVLRTRDRVSDIRKALPYLFDLVPHIEVVTANIHPTHEAIVEGPDEIILTTRRTLKMAVGDVQLALGPRSFTQTNTEVAGKLYRQVTEWAVSDNEADHPRSAWDLYCGVGGFALHLAAAGITPVTGVEVSDQAIASAIQGARQLKLGRADAQFIAKDATAWAARQPEESRPDVLVINPPRRGIGSELASWINESGIPRVIYSSCNPKSLAHDLTEMPSYRGLEARIFDMFPHTDHVETAVLMSRVGA